MFSLCYDPSVYPFPRAEYQADVGKYMWTDSIIIYISSSLNHNILFLNMESSKILLWPQLLLRRRELNIHQNDPNQKINICVCWVHYGVQPALFLSRENEILNVDIKNRIDVFPWYREGKKHQLNTLYSSKL